MTVILGFPIYTLRADQGSFLFGASVTLNKKPVLLLPQGLLLGSASPATQQGIMGPWKLVWGERWAPGQNLVTHLLRVKVIGVRPGAAQIKSLGLRPGVTAKPIVSQWLPTNKHFTDIIFISEWPFQ